MTTSAVLWVSFEELRQCVCINEQQMLELIEQEIITPASGHRREEWQFTMSAISVANKAARIHADLVVDWADIPLVMNLLGEIDTLRTENERLKQRLNRFQSDQAE